MSVVLESIRASVGSMELADEVLVGLAFDGLAVAEHKTLREAKELLTRLKEAAPMTPELEQDIDNCIGDLSRCC